MRTKTIVLSLILFTLPLVPAAAHHKPGHNKGGPQAVTYQSKGRAAAGNHHGHGGSNGALSNAGYHRGGPPPWAPAHGYRRKSGHTDVYVQPFGIDLGRCNREAIGAVLGAATGGLAGSQIGKGSGQTAAIIGGTILGAVIGGSIGRSMDEVDQNCIGQALEHASDGQQIVWQNPDSGSQYQVVPTQTVQQSDGRYCREYTATAGVNGRNQQTYGRACRQPDGSWQIVR